MRILLIEDEEKLASFIRRGLKEERYVVDIAADGDKGLFLAEVNTYDLILLDIILPGRDGLSVCKELRDKGIDAPILILTARSELKDKVEGLHIGADDYLTKPFAFEELLARVAALLRRKRKDVSGSILRAVDLELDQLSHKVMRCGKEIILTAKEYALLEYFLLNPDLVITRTMISEHVWNEEFDTFTNVIDVYVNYLRQKIDKGFNKKLIHTVRGVGYTLKAGIK